MKKLTLVSVLFSAFCAVANPATAQETTGSLDDSLQMYESFNFDESMNWSDCFDFNIGFGIDFCPGFPTPYPTLTLEYKYMEPVAMVEVVPDPWRSFLYKESFYNFSGKAESAIAENLGVSPTIGSGFSNRKATSGGKEFIGSQRMETHVWAVSDWWRLKTSDQADSCLSLTCKNKDYTGCIMSIKKTMSSVSSGTMKTISSINSNQSAEGKGQGVKNGENNQVVYEDGSVYEEKEITKTTRHGDGDYTTEVVGTEYEQTREPGNYGDDAVGQMADVAMSESVIPGMSNAELLAEGIAAAEDPEGYVAGKAIGVATETAGEAWENSETKKDVDAGMAEASEQASEWGDSFKESFSASEEDEEEAEPLPESTKSGGASKEEEPSPLSNLSDKGSASFSIAGNEISDNAFGNDSVGNTDAREQMQNATGMAAGVAGGAINQGLMQAYAMLDRVVFFSVIEQMMQMIATVSPVMVHPVYMSERHEKASADGGFFWSPIFQSFSEKGAGFIMPIFCMSKTAGMGIDAVANMMGFDIPSDALGALSAFINGRCVGSWGPLEPRVNLLGTGDAMVAAGLASVRGLNIAQNITGDMYNKSINNTPFNQLKFNLDWPHKSSCYGFQGASGLSRGWTTPLGGALDNVVNKVRSGNAVNAASDLATDTVGKAT
ncbi:MAG TPA: hypothetical protein DCL21_04350, partial [Alphaproteobacteria bacterium]|nr:hypothetical protein [Alphaproteobacteria bacterium]